MSQADDQRWDRGLGLRDIRASLLEIEGGGLALLEPGLGDLERALLDFHVAAGEGDPLLEGANLHVGRRHVGQKRDHGIAIAFDGSLEFRVRRFELPAQVPPEIELPGGVEAGRPYVERSRGRRLRVAEQVEVLADLGMSIIADGVLRLGEKIARRDVPLGLRLQDARGRALQIEILLASRVD